MEKAEKILSMEVTRGRTPSVHYAFFSDAGIIYEFSKGYANIENRIETGPGTTFPIYSITKTFTALSILQLVQNKYLSLDKPVISYLPDSPLGKDVTVAHLLTHTSGLDNPFPINWIHLKEEHAAINRDRFFQPIISKSATKTNAPGLNFRYSNLGYLILGQLIEAIHNITYENYVADNILKELHLQNDVIGFSIPHSTLHATGYHNNRSLSMLFLRMAMDTSKYMRKAVGKWKPFREVYMNGTPYGGIIANTHGIIKYGRELLKDNGCLITDEYKQYLFNESKTTNGKPTGMCLSWFKGITHGKIYYCHAGGGGGYYAELRLYPEIKKGSFIVFNRSGFSDKRFLDKVDVYSL